MAATESTMLPLGTALPSFSLPDPRGKTVTPADFKDARGLLVAFLCNHCPFVKHIGGGLAALVREYQAKGIAAVGINANDADAYPDDSPERMAEEAKSAGYTFPYLFDGTQAVAKAFRAACTPDFFLFDGNRRRVYRGQFDASRPGNNVPVTGKDLKDAMDAVLAGKPVPAAQKPSLGCNIKWRPGNEPEYFGAK